MRLGKEESAGELGLDGGPALGQRGAASAPRARNRSAPARVSATAARAQRRRRRIGTTPAGEEAIGANRLGQRRRCGEDRCRER